MLNELKAAQEIKAKLFARYISISKLSTATWFDRAIATARYMDAAKRVEEIAEEMSVQ